MLQGDPADPLWEHGDLSGALEQHIESLSPDQPLIVEKLKGHTDATHIHTGETTEEALRGNRAADKAAEKGWEKHKDSEG